MFKRSEESMGKYDFTSSEVRLLLICDESRAGKLLHAFEEAGAQLSCDRAESLDAVAALLLEKRHEVAVIDRDMTSLSWEDTLESFRTVNPDLPVIVTAASMGAEEDTSRALDCLKHGAADYFVKEKSGAAAVLYRILRDARERRLVCQAEKKHRQAEKRYRGMIENAVKGMFQCTPDGDLTGANPAMLRILGLEHGIRPDADALWKAFVEPDDFRVLLSLIREHGRMSDFETRIRRNDDRTVWISFSGGLVYDESGAPCAVEGAMEDVTRRKAVESMIIRAKKEWECTFDCVGDCILILDTDCRVKRMNMALADRLGVHPRDVVGKDCQDVFDLAGESCDGERVSERIRSMTDGGLHSQEISIPALGGEYLVNASPFYLEDQKPAGTVLTAHDISIRKGLEAKLRHSQKMEAIGTLAGGIAHDFNNILGVMMGYSEMCMENSKDETMQDRLEQIMRAGTRATDLIRQILTFSRQEESNLMPLSLAATIKEITKMLRASLPKNIEITEELSEVNDTVMANLTQIHQVLMNLSANAAHAMGEDGGELRIALDELCVDDNDIEAACEKAPRMLRLSISDNGSGIDPAIIDQIFDPFFTTKKPGEGTGMGLAMVHGIVQGHGGSISVQSTLGRGSVFTVLLPEAQAKVLPKRESETAAPSGRGRVLYVDDEEQLVDIGREMLESLGFTAYTAPNAEKALELFRQDPKGWDLIVTDQSMPGMTGYQMAEQILSERPDVPIIMCTGYSETMTAEKAKAVGIRDFLFKPVLKRDLARSIDGIFAEGTAETEHKVKEDHFPTQEV
jgi:PAS domain S-box-containing protein